MSGEVEKDFQEIQIRMASLMTGMGEPVLKLLDPKPGERILDMGCGLGVLAEEMVKMGCEVVAIDVNSQAVEATRLRNVDARLMNAEIISADAIQLYKKLDIGSAKPTEEERRGIVHHMMDCIEPDEPRFTVSRFRDGAIEAANWIIAKGKRPLVVGGTGLYINALTYPLTFSQIAPGSRAPRRLCWRLRLLCCLSRPR